MIDAQALTSMQERLRAINKLGVDYTLIVRYTLAFGRNRTDSSSDKWWASWACAR